MMPEANSHRWELPIDPARLVHALRARWPLLALGCAALAVLGFVWGYVNGRFTASVKLVRSELPTLVDAGGDADGPALHPLSAEELVNLAQSPSVVRRAAQSAEGLATPDEVVGCSEISHVPNGGLITIKVRLKEAEPAVKLVNAYAGEVLRITQEMQSNEVKEARALLQTQLLALDRELEQTSQELVGLLQKSGLVDFEKEPAVPLQQWTELNRKCESLRSQMETLDLQIQSLLKEVSKYMPNLVAAKEALDRALLRYTEEHPKIKELRATIAELEAQVAQRGLQTDLDVASWGNSPAVSLYQQVVELRRQRIALEKQAEESNRLRQQLEREIDSLPIKQLAYAKVKSTFQSLKQNREQLAQREQKLRLLTERSADSYRLVERARVDELGRSEKWKSGITAGILSGILGGLATVLILWLFEWTDGRIRSSEDLRRVTRLPVLATLGDLSAMSEAEQQDWAFRALTALKGTLNHAGGTTLVCGFVSSLPGEGRTTWINLLAAAARRIGYRTLTISAPAPSRKTDSGDVPEANRLDLPEASQAVQLPCQLGDPVPAAWPYPVGDLSLPGWTWNLERRAKWREALEQWAALENLVVLVELPPASVAESILLAEHLPHVIWLCGKDMAKSSETRLHLETLRQGRSRLAGSVFNEGAAAVMRQRVVYAIGLLMVSLGLLTLDLGAQPADTPPAQPESPKENSAVAVTPFSPNQLAEWQKRLTLGPGDVLDISMYEQPDSARAGLSIGPDGRINYLEARDVMAAGLTVDEFRAKLENILGKFHRSPRVVINPGAFNSKKYFVLGNVNTRGVFPLDRTASIIEAIARARGFVTGGSGTTPVGHRNPVVQADLQRSFLIRRGAEGSFHRVAVDFEGLFLRGDLSQNIALEPDDYLFFPPLDLQEVYVLGAVGSPGAVPYTPEATTLGAILSRGGFTSRSWRQKVLVVRGSLNHPQTFVVDMAAILSAKGPDFPLSNRDIIYVHEKPWARAQELLEMAVMGFANAFITGYTTTHVGPFITEPIVK